ncbi:catalase-like [Diaphorina citri]|uniref:Catalase-like n=1 Tax=Diaphorina citri TaxID=121845 RepID=A0A1S3D6R6_DIACI|nr:catalase-like [Diaphorina citri]
MWLVDNAGRLFSYPDTHRHRLGPNYLQLPVNCPFATKVANYQRDGPMAFNNQGGAPNYFPNSFSGPQESERGRLSTFAVSGDVARAVGNFSQVNAEFGQKLRAGLKAARSKSNL